MRLPTRSFARPRRHRSAQRGASLIMVMMILIIVSILGVAGVQISLMSERGARNDRDQQIASQAAESALMDAEIELFAKTTATGNRQSAVFSPALKLEQFSATCGTSGTSIGLCTLAASGKPAWLTVDFTNTSSSAPTVKFGTFTGRTFKAGAVGIQPVQEPRYVIEPVPDHGVEPDASKPAPYMYRVTAMGFGPRQDTQVVMQMLYRN